MEQNNQAISQTISALPLPRIDAIAEWETPIALEQLQHWMTALVPFYNQSMPTVGLADAARATAEALQAAGYTSAEVRFAFRRMWSDKTIVWIFAKNSPLNPGVFIPHIEELRGMQHALLFDMRHEMVMRLCRQFPSDLHPHDFGPGNFGTGRDSHTRLYRYKKQHLLREASRNSKRLAAPQGAIPIRQLVAAYATGGNE